MIEGMQALYISVLLRLKKMEIFKEKFESSDDISLMCKSMFINENLLSMISRSSFQSNAMMLRVSL